MINPVLIGSFTMSIYVLRLQGGKYYVGKSDNPTKRLEEHRAGEGTEWTQIHTPISIDKVIPMRSKFDEDNVTKEYMSEYGIENVRGGSYTNVQLTAWQRKVLQQELRTADDLCFRCGEKGHYARECNEDSECEEGDDSDCDDEEDEYEDVWVCEKCNHKFSDEESCITRHRVVVCFRCNRPGHYASDCYARTTNDGEYLWY
jgi:predicted GIY-YIG superfamily endonuclease